MTPNQFGQGIVTANNGINYCVIQNLGQGYKNGNLVIYYLVGNLTDAEESPINPFIIDGPFTN